MVLGVTILVSYLNKENFLYRLTQKYVSKHFPGYQGTKR